MNKIKVCVAGATGWAGSALSKGIYSTQDVELVSAISRSHAGRILGEVIGMEGVTTPVYATAEEALQTHPDVLVEYTKPEAAKSHVLAALRGGAHAVIGTSGLSNEDYEEIDALAFHAPLDRSILRPRQAEHG
jgi:4-hydroxy-tetrahydrodipicolinate reductase